MAELLAQSPEVFVLIAFLFALLVGSFLNVVIYRLPIMMFREWEEQCKELQAADTPTLPEQPFNLVVPRSACPNCGKQIKAWQNIPVISYLLLRGRCGGCQQKISARYPVVEFLTAFLAAICALRMGFGLEALMAIGLTFALVAISMIDYDHQLIPDSIVLPLLWVGLTMSLFHDSVGGSFLFVSPRDSIIGAIAGYLSLWSVYKVFKLLTGKEGMGYGDFKLLAAIGAWLGWELLHLVILLSAVVGALFGIAMIVFRGRDRQLPIPFGPYLAAAGWVTMLWGEQLWNAYLDKFA
jgi:leader peptidase (prepilin peptidase)/N-methyltransferase